MFTQTFLQIAKLFLFMITGFVLTRKQVLPAEAPKVFSKLLVWVSCPALYLKTFSSQFTPEKLPVSLRLMLISTAALAAAWLLSAVLGRRITGDPYKRKVFSYSLCVPNFGYMGNVLILALLGESTLLDYQIFVIPVTAFMITVGYSMLLEKKTELRSLVNPMVIAMLAGIVLGLLRIPLPGFILDTLDSAAGCMGPLSMILAGCVIAEFDLRSILSVREVYFTVAVRMVLMPLLVLAAGRLFRIPEEWFFLLLAFECLPAGLNSVVYPSTIGRDCSLGAGIALVSNLTAVVTVPFFFSLI